MGYELEEEEEGEGALDLGLISEAFSFLNLIPDRVVVSLRNRLREEEASTGKEEGESCGFSCSLDPGDSA